MVPAKDAATLRAIYGRLRLAGLTEREARRLVVDVLGIGLTSSLTARVQLVAS